MSFHPWYKCWWDIELIRDGKVIWGETRQNSLVDAGERAMLDCFYRNLNAPTQFYIRLAEDTVAEADALIDVKNEPSGNGYAPILIERSSTGFPILEQHDADWRVTSKTVSFMASGGQIGPVNTMFLATSSDNSGFLVAAVPLSTEVTLQDGDVLQARFRIKLR